MQPIPTLLSTENAATGTTISKTGPPVEANFQGQGVAGFFDILLDHGTPQAEGEPETLTADELVVAEVFPMVRDERPSSDQGTTNTEHLYQPAEEGLLAVPFDRRLSELAAPQNAGRGEPTVAVHETQDTSLPKGITHEGQDAVRANVEAGRSDGTRAEVIAQTEHISHQPPEGESDKSKPGNTEVARQERANLDLASMDRTSTDARVSASERNGAAVNKDMSGEMHSSEPDDASAGTEKNQRFHSHPNKAQSAGANEAPVSSAGLNEHNTQRRTAVRPEGEGTQPDHDGNRRGAERAGQTLLSASVASNQTAPVRSGRSERYEGAPDVPPARTVASPHVEMSRAPTVTAQTYGVVLPNPLIVSDAAIPTDAPAAIEAAVAEIEDGIKQTVADRARPEPAAARSIVSQVVHAVARPQADGTVEIRLQPEELGRVRLSMSPGEVGVTVQITAERPETLDLLRRNIDMLQAELADRGFSEMSSSFGAETSDDETTGREDEHPRRDPLPDQAGVTQVDIITSESPSLNGKLDIRV